MRRHTLSLIVATAGIWLLLSGHYTPLLLSLGAGSCALVVIVAGRMGVVDREAQPVHLLTRLPGYWFWLGGQILQANGSLSRLMFRLHPDISPTVSRVVATEKTELGQTIYANSMTLTPGTVAVGLQEGTIQVHGLTREHVALLNEGEMHRRILALERAAGTTEKG